MKIPMLRRQCLVLAVLGTIAVSAQWVDWQNQYPYTGHRVYSHTMHRTSDGNLLLCASIHGGWTPGSGIPFEDWAIATYLVKIQPSGDTLWTQRIDSIKPWAITHVVDLMDGNTLIAGTAQSSYEYCGMGVSALPMAQLFALKIDQAGSTLWWHQYDQPCTRVLADAWETPAQQIHLLALDTQQPNIMIGYDPPNWFEHHTLDTQGNTLGMTTFQQADMYYTYQHGAPAFDGGRYVLASVFDTIGQNSMFVQLEKLASNGTPQGAVFVTDTSYLTPLDLITTLDSGLLMLMSPDYARSRLIHTDTQGNILWDRTYLTRFQEVVVLPDTTYLAVGTYGTFLTPNMREMCVTLISSAGDSLWSRMYGDSLNDLGSSLVTTPNGFLAYGTKDMYSGWVPPRLFISEDTLGFFTQIARAGSQALSLEIYPNPATQGITVRIPSDQVLRDDLLVFDPVGRVVRRVRARPGPIVIDVQDLSVGHYTLVVVTDAGRSAAHFVVEH